MPRSYLVEKQLSYRPAAREGNLEMLQLMESRGAFRLANIELALEDAVKGGKRDNIEFLLKCLPKSAVPRLSRKNFILRWPTENGFVIFDLINSF